MFPRSGTKKMHISGSGQYHEVLCGTILACACHANILHASYKLCSDSDLHLLESKADSS